MVSDQYSVFSGNRGIVRRGGEFGLRCDIGRLGQVSLRGLNGRRERGEELLGLAPATEAGQGNGLNGGLEFGTAGGAEEQVGGHGDLAVAAGNVGQRRTEAGLKRSANKDLRYARLRLLKT